jgi:hypothetical protein
MQMWTYSGGARRMTFEECELCGRWFKFTEPHTFKFVGGESEPSKVWCLDCENKFIKLVEEGVRPDIDP